jgi:hypothetical protein
MGNPKIPSISARRKQFCEHPQACRARGDGLCRHCAYGESLERASKSIGQKLSRRARKSPPVTLARHA